MNKFSSNVCKLSDLSLISVVSRYFRINVMMGKKMHTHNTKFDMMNKGKLNGLKIAIAGCKTYLIGLMLHDDFSPSYAKFKKPGYDVIVRILTLLNEIFQRNAQTL